MRMQSLRSLKPENSKDSSLPCLQLSQLILETTCEHLRGHLDWALNSTSWTLSNIAYMSAPHRPRLWSTKIAEDKNHYNLHPAELRSIFNFNIVKCGIGWLGWRGHNEAWRVFAIVRGRKFTWVRLLIMRDNGEPLLLRWPRILHQI